jgi:hypothetical protein
MLADSSPDLWHFSRLVSQVNKRPTLAGFQMTSRRKECIIAVLLLGFMTPAFAGDPKAGGYSPEMQARSDQGNGPP